MDIEQTQSILEAAKGAVCRRCGTPTQKRTHDCAKPGKSTYYAWWFRCKCGWMYMPPEAIRQADRTIRTELPARTAPFDLSDRYIPNPADALRDPTLMPWE